MGQPAAAGRCKGTEQLRRRSSRLLLALGGLSFLCPLRAQPPVFRSDVVLVSVDVEVLDRRHGKPIPSLEAWDFVVEENGEQRPIVGCFSDDGTPLDVVVVLQLNPDRGRDNVPIFARRHFFEALDELRPDDRVSVMSFGFGPKVALRFSTQHLALKAAVRELLRIRTFRRSWRLYDALLAAVELFPATPVRGRRRVVLLLFDRGERGSLAKPERVVETAFKKRAVIYGVHVPHPAHPPTRWVSVGLPKGPVATGVIWGDDREEPADSIHPAIEQTGGELLAGMYAGGLISDCIDRMRRRYILYFYAGKSSSRDESRTVVATLSPQAQRRHPDAIVRGQRVYRVPTPTAGQDEMTPR